MSFPCRVQAGDDSERGQTDIELENSLDDRPSDYEVTHIKVV